MSYVSNVTKWCWCTDYLIRCKFALDYASNSMAEADATIASFVKNGGNSCSENNVALLDMSAMDR